MCTSQCDRRALPQAGHSSLRQEVVETVIRAKPGGVAALSSLPSHVREELRQDFSGGLTEKAYLLMDISNIAVVSKEHGSKDQPRLFSAGHTLPLVLVTALFLFWGIPSNMNDILIKQFMKSF